MQPNAGAVVHGLDGFRYRLHQEIGKGGQGSVWSLTDNPMLVAKFYHSGIAASDLKKFEAMCRLRTDALNSVAAWPISLLSFAPNGSPHGILMRRVSNCQAVHQLYGLKSRLRLFPEAQFPFLLHTALNTARGFATVHNAGQIIGDVNHSNLMVSQTATVSMIDCDSFQITEGKTIYPCPVGVPDFTPPELQGKSFGSQARTTQSDAFGLAVLIFQLLWGRHPYMGSNDPRTNEIRSIDQAIAEYRFPYALSPNSQEVLLPTYLPKLADYPTQIGDYFKRAFTRTGTSASRPNAEEWVAALSSLTNQLKQCSVNSNHHYYAGGQSCPWCRFEGAIGTAVFGVKITLLRDAEFNLVGVWAQIEGVKPIAELLRKPTAESMLQTYFPNPAIPELLRKRRILRSWSLATFVTSISIAVYLNSGISVLIIMLAVVVSSVLWHRGRSLVKAFSDGYKQVKAQYFSADESFERSSQVPDEFMQERRKLEEAKVSYEGLKPQKAKRLAELDAGRKKKQLQRFLERFRLEDERIPLIGDKNKLVLSSFNISDAWDVEERKLSNIKGFGPKKIEALLSWRASKERQFRFDPGLPIDALDLRNLDQEFAQKTSALRSVLISGPQRLNQVVTIWNAHRRQRLGQLGVVAGQYAQAMVDRKALAVF